MTANIETLTTLIVLVLAVIAFAKVAQFANASPAKRARMARNTTRLLGRGIVGTIRLLGRAAFLILLTLAHTLDGIARFLTSPRVDAFMYRIERAIEDWVHAQIDYYRARLLGIPIP